MSSLRVVWFGWMLWGCGDGEKARSASAVSPGGDADSGGQGSGDDGGGGAGTGGDSGSGPGGDSGSDTGVDADGEWARIGGIYGSQYAEGVAVDVSGDILFGGSFVNGIDLGDGGFASFGSDDVLIGRLHGGDGSLRWNEAVRDDGSDVAYDVALAPDGAVYVAGWFEDDLEFPTTVLSSKGEDDGFLARWESDGTFAWVLQLGGTGDDRMRSVVADSAGACVAGFSTNGITGTGLPLGGVSVLDGVVVCVDSVGIPAWGKVLGFGSGTAPALAITLSETHVHAGGYFTGELDVGGGRVASAGERDAWVMSWPRDGGDGEGVTFGASGDQEIRGLIHSAGALFAVGSWSGGDTPDAQSPAGASDAYLASISGTELDSILLIGGPGADEALDVAASSSGELALTGASDDAITLAEAHAPYGDFDIWVGVYREGWIRSARYGGPGEDKGRAIAWHPSGDLVLGGTSEGQIAIGGTVLEGYGDRDLLLARVAP